MRHKIEHLNFKNKADRTKFLRLVLKDIQFPGKKDNVLTTAMRNENKAVLKRTTSSIVNRNHARHAEVLGHAKKLLEENPSRPLSEDEKKRLRARAIKTLANQTKRLVFATDLNPSKSTWRALFNQVKQECEENKDLGTRLGKNKGQMIVPMFGDDLHEVLNDFLSSILIPLVLKAAEKLDGRLAPGGKKVGTAIVKIGDLK
jgi:hypothetical protein